MLRFSKDVVIQVETVKNVPPRMCQATTVFVLVTVLGCTLSKFEYVAKVIKQ